MNVQTNEHSLGCEPVTPPTQVNTPSQNVLSVYCCITMQPILLSRQLTYSIKAVDGYGLERSPHHGVLLQYFIEVVHGERVQSAVGVRPHAGGSSSTGQQADLCESTGHIMVVVPESSVS